MMRNAQRTRNAQHTWLTLALCASITAAPAWAVAGAADDATPKAGDAMPAAAGEALPAMADEAVPPTASNQRPPATLDTMTAPAPQTYGSVEAINGGVDSDQANAIKRMAPQYKLRVELSGRGGQYEVADRLELLSGGQGGSVVAEIADAGPWVLLDVPPGRYTLQGQFGDRTLQRNVTVAAAGTTVHWVLPATID